MHLHPSVGSCDLIHTRNTTFGYIQASEGETEQVSINKQVGLVLVISLTISHCTFTF